MDCAGARFSALLGGYVPAFCGRFAYSVLAVLRGHGLGGGHALFFKPIHIMVRMRSSAILVLLAFLSPRLLVNAQTEAPSSQTQEQIPVMDGGAGPCSLELTITDTLAKPVYAAIIKVHIAYGFAGIRRLDLEAGTNSDGKVKFTGLPRRVHQAPLEFRASKDDLQGLATYDPSAECDAKRSISISKTKAEASH